MSHQHRNILVALAGQPNCGKSTAFNMLTGARQHVANFPGVTVEKKQGVFQSGETRVELVDLPGTYSLSSHSQEERVARDFILLERPEAVVAVVDASNLERHLHLVFQLREMGMPLVLCLNMTDVAERRGITVDADALSEALGVPVVPTVASRGQGGEELKEAIIRTAISANHDPGDWRIDYGTGLEPTLDEITGRLRRHHHLVEDFSPRWLAVKLMEDDKEARRIALHHTHDNSGAELGEWIDERLHELRGDAPQLLSRAIVAARRREAARIVEQCVTNTGGGDTLSDRVDQWLCSPLTGVPMVALLMYVTFTVTFCLADGDSFRWVPWFNGWTTPVGVLGWLFGTFLPSLIEGMAEGPLKSLLADGVIGGVGGVISFTPFIFFMFIFLSILEESGLVARIAFVMDRFLRVFGLPGSSVLPLVISGGITGGCAVPGVLATRTMADERDRLVTMLVAPFMNCGAKIPVYLMLIAAFFSDHKAAVMWVLMAISWMVALMAATLLRRTVVPGEQTPFLLELPCYRMPTIRAVLQTALQRSWLYVKKAGTVILAVNVVMWGLMYLPRADTSLFDAQVKAAQNELVETTSETGEAALFTGEALRTTRGYIDNYSDAVKANDEAALALLQTRDPKRYALARAVCVDEETEGANATVNNIVPPETVAAYQLYLDRVGSIERALAQAQLRQSFAGRVGRALAHVSQAAGLGWRDNIALIGGVAAKEVVVSTLGTAYSLGADELIPDEDDPAARNPLAEHLQSDPAWSPRRAFALMVFVMLYAPCVPTIAVLWSEAGSWRWAAFSVIYSTTIAFALAVLVYQGAGILGFA